MLTLIVSGMPGAGKEEFLEIAKKNGIPFVRMGDVVREFYAASDSADNGVSVGSFADGERKRFGKNVWAKRTLERMTGNAFLVDGCRSMDEIRSFRELGGNIKIVSILSPPEARYERLVNRKRDDAPRSISEFDERDSREISWGIGEVIALSDIVIVNSSSLEDFRKTSAEILKEVIG
jgi:Dephospho-CoA kinase